MAVAEEIADEKERGNFIEAAIDLPNKEAQLHWLEQVCGVRAQEIPYWLSIRDEVTGLIHIFNVFSDKEFAEELAKYDELESQGHQLNTFEGVPYFFREYLWKQRQKNEDFARDG